MLSSLTRHWLGYPVGCVINHKFKLECDKKLRWWVRTPNLKAFHSKIKTWWARAVLITRDFDGRRRSTYGDCNAGRQNLLLLKQLALNKFYIWVESFQIWCSHSSAQLFIIFQLESVRKAPSMTHPSIQSPFIGWGGGVRRLLSDSRTADRSETSDAALKRSWWDDLKALPEF